MDRDQLLSKYDELFEELTKDEELMLKVLIHQFGGIRELYDMVHFHITSLHDISELEDEDLETEVNNVLNAYREVVNLVVEESIGL